MKTYFTLFFILLSFATLVSCSGDRKAADQQNKTIVLKGLYSYGPELRTFTDCGENHEYWVVDSAKTLELAYTNLGFEKPYTPVYIEVECKMVKSDTTIVPAGYDSTMVVTKLNKITQQFPEGPCNQ